MKHGSVSSKVYFTILTIDSQIKELYIFITNYLILKFSIFIIPRRNYQIHLPTKREQMNRLHKSSFFILPSDIKRIFKLVKNKFVIFCSSVCLQADR